MKDFKEVPYKQFSLWDHVYEWLSEHSWYWDDAAEHTRKKFVTQVTETLWEQAMKGVSPQKTIPKCCLISVYVCPVDLTVEGF